jgi:hypothetical protein
MKTNFEYMRDRLLAKKGLLEPESGPRWSLDRLEAEWNPTFEQYMRNRLMMGALRYGGINNPNNKGNQTGFNTDEMLKRTYEYVRTGNAELLVDVANFALCEFHQRPHPDFHFEAKDRL